uniref:Excretory secretory protein n=1 Tax=Teladorsagia circumcincta TaxID=45464 RepID=M1ZJD7_TELCI|nr:excretory secretory protein [Teladorsagia circumcincta]
MLRSILLILVSASVYVSVQGQGNGDMKKVELYMGYAKKDMEKVREFLKLKDERLTKLLSDLFRYLDKTTFEWMKDEATLEQFIQTRGKFSSALVHPDVQKRYKDNRKLWAFRYARLMNCIGGSDMGRATAYLPGVSVQEKEETLRYSLKLERTCAYTYFR